MPKKILILDSSQIDTFGQCHTQWDLAYRQSLISNDAKENTPMDMGTYGHKLLEIIYKERAKGNGQNALDLAFKYDIDKETCRCSHGEEKHDYFYKEDILEDGSLDAFMESPCQAIGCHCQSFEPIDFPLSAPDRAFVRDRVMEYTFVEGAIGSGIPLLIPKSSEHVEVGFSHKLYEDESRLYILEGRIDLIGQIAPNCEEGWADHKFQSRERDLYLKSIQFRNYSLVLERSLGVVNYIRFAKKVEKGKTFKRAIISFSRQEIRDWEEEVLDIFHRVELYQNRLERHELEKEDHEWSSCAGKFGYPCDFTKICDYYRNPELTQLTIEQSYKKKPEWRPW